MSLDDDRTFVDDPENAYLAEVHKVPPLSREEEIRCPLGFAHRIKGLHREATTHPIHARTARKAFLNGNNRREDYGFYFGSALACANFSTSASCVRTNSASLPSGTTFRYSRRSSAEAVKSCFCARITPRM